MRRVSVLWILLALLAILALAAFPGGGLIAGGSGGVHLACGTTGSSSCG